MSALDRILARDERWVPAVLVVLGVCYFICPNARLDFSIFDTRDAESYLALSRSLVAGLGYTRSLDPQYYIPHTTWPPGVPILLAPAMALAGVPIDLLVVKGVLIAYGVLGIMLAYLYARRLSPSPLVRLTVPLLLGFNPYYWHFSRMADSEMPTVVWSLLVLLLADIGWARGLIKPGTAFAIGLAAGFGMLIRGSFFGALLLPAVYLVILRKDDFAWRAMAGRYALYVVGFLVPFVAWMARNRSIDTQGLGGDGINQIAMIFRTSPVDPNSPFRTVAQVTADVIANLRDSAIYLLPKSIVPGLWPFTAWTSFGDWKMPVAIILCIGLLILSLRRARNLPIVVMYGSMAALNVLYAVGGLPRLWVPVECLLALSLPLGFETLAIPGGARARVALVGAAMVVLALNLTTYIVEHERHPYHDPRYAALADLFHNIRMHDGVSGNVLTPDPQAFELLTGLPAPMSLPAIGVDPSYSYAVVPTEEWQVQTIGGTVLVQNEDWALVKLGASTTLGDIRKDYNCANSSVAAFAVLTRCMIR